ncbi:MAG TPA: C45 family peptidase, partial [Steroidobacteraceae bacterium]|nr:C45 family peptidase [Steroidobacteraceae bacterium]
MTSFRSSSTDPATRGLEFGATFARQIRDNITLYRALFQRVATRPFDLESLGAKALEKVARFAPPLHDEMRGIAQGAGVEPELVGAINARTEILAALYARERGECSAVVRIDPFSSRALALQTWDWYSEFADQWLVWEIPHAGGRLTRTVTEFGIVGKAGVNNRGLGVLFNILHHERDGLGEMGVPVHVVARWVLDRATDLAHALQLINPTPVSASSALTLVAAVDGTS